MSNKKKPPKLKEKDEILFPYEAWRFLRNHPKFRLPCRMLVKKDNIRDYQKPYIIEKPGDVYIYQEPHIFWYAIERNLSVHYVLVNKHGTTDAPKEERTFTEVWLEFGPPYYYGDLEDEYNAAAREKNGESCWQAEIYPEMYCQQNTSHDWELDCGAPTFDEALIKLANLVKRFYGDYVDDNDGYKTCGGQDGGCLYCKSIREYVLKIREKWHIL